MTIQVIKHDFSCRILELFATHLRKEPYIHYGLPFDRHDIHNKREATYCPCRCHP